MSRRKTPLPAPPPTGFEPVEEVTIRGYGCIQKATFPLTPLHAFIGPNDSGKSTILRAIRTAFQAAAGRWVRSNGVWAPFDPLWNGAQSPAIEVRLRGGLRYVLTAHDAERGAVVEALSGPGGSPELTANRPWSSAGLLCLGSAVAYARRFTSPTLLRFSPDSLRAPCKQLTADQPIQFVDETGRGLAAVYQALATRNVDHFVTLRDRVRTLFPALRQIRVPATGEGNVELQMELASGDVVPAAAMGEGLLYFLGFVATLHLESTRLILVEEPENGLHPARIAEVMRILREVSKDAQVLLTTHSPLVVNELGPHEVTVVTRDEDGTHGQPIAETPRFGERAKVYALGELWLSSANGTDDISPKDTAPTKRRRPPGPPG